ncbi:hybrid sensor histidine kinase/response regulator [Microvirga subterranea]|uniref:histidine kinase n=1 Tax=Microvirga subterranea TaxID=186651 RepID=A0A370HQF2_9HYPH|nr:hybrid sensor histidine kinase/response regulator [Microvirga subterranea]RDI60782.1 two-component system NtrC family sensor kinase [Microvirga subterranea]
MTSRSLRFGLSLAPALALALGIVFLGSLELVRSYHEAGALGEEAAQNLVHVLAEQTERTFQAVDFTLIGMRDALSMHQDTSENDPAFRQALKERLEVLPFVRALFVIGPDGFITHDTDYPSTPRVSLADSPYFKAHRDNSKLGLFVGYPLRSRSLDRWFVSFSRRVDNPDGSFSRIVVAAVEPRYFENFYQGLSVGEGGFIALLMRDGTLLARNPASDDAIGKAFSTAEPVSTLLASRHQGVYWATSPVDGTPRIVGYQALSTSPAVVLVGLAQRTVFKPWYKHAAVVLVTAMILLGLIGSLIYLVLRNRRREQIELARLSRNQRLESLGRIAGGIAHDFGNTIRIVQSSVLLLRPLLSGNAEGLSILNDVEHALSGAKAMIESLMTFSRRQELRPQVTVIDSQIAWFAPILRQAAGPRISVTFNLGSSAMVCSLDPVQFEAALLNLVLNARDAMPNGGTILIETSVTSNPHLKDIATQPDEGARPWVLISVIDAGQGMPPSVLEQAFDPFFTTKAEGQGSGLGLSQVLGFVQQSAGEIRLESEQGRGTRAILMFPAIGQRDQEVGPSQETENSAEVDR